MQALARRGEHRVAEARARLSAGQIIFAEWLTVPSSERSPKTQKELAIQLGVSEQTLCEWKKIPELREVMDDIFGTLGRELIPDAIKVLKDLLKDAKSKGALDAAKTILDRWGEVAKHGHIIATLKDMYKEYPHGKQLLLHPHFP